MILAHRQGPGKQHVLDKCVKICAVLLVARFLIMTKLTKSTIQSRIILNQLPTGEAVEMAYAVTTVSVRNL